jgi:hypothetical protein
MKEKRLKKEIQSMYNERSKGIEESAEGGEEEIEVKGSCKCFPEEIHEI